MDALTLDRACALQRYWAKFPPVHLLVRAFVGMNDDEPAPRPRGVSSPVAARSRPKTNLPAYMRKHAR